MAHETILIIDDHALFRSGIVSMLSTAFDDVPILDSASLEDALATVALVPSVVLLDMQLPGIGGLEGMSLLRQRWPAARIVVVSAHDRPDRVDAALARGAAAFLSKSDRPERMMTVLRGMLEQPPAPHGRGAVRPALTPRQTEVLDLRATRDVARDRRVERLLFLSKIVEGSILGSLLWIGLPAQVPSVSILLMSLMGAICSNGVSLLAPRRHLYLALVVPVATLAFVTLWSLGGTPSRALAICSILYVAGQYGQVVLASRRVRELIELRFENTTLVDQLRAETATARLARRDAEQANDAKSRFLAAASHDLRQPVHALGLFLQALSQTDLESRQRQIVRNAQAATIASTDMLDTLLDFSRLEAGVVTPRSTTFMLQPLLDKLENELAPLADAKCLIYRSPPTDIAVSSDAALLELVLRNFVLNAVRYTDRGGLLIGCRRRGAGVSIEVHDTGIGIAEDQRDEIFREFHQLGNPERDRRKGLGLGLAIARRLAVSLDHPLSVSSTEGRGSVFRILVPRAVEAATEGDRSPDIPASGGLAGARILIVEDDAIVREAMVQFLSGWGCRCWAVEMPGDAVSLLQGEPAPDALICDYRLREGLTGAGAIAMLRRHWGRPIPAIMITGDTAPARMREALDSGVPLIHKPVRPDKLHRDLLTLISPRVPPTTPSSVSGTVPI